MRAAEQLDSLSTMSTVRHTMCNQSCVGNAEPCAAPDGMLSCRPAVLPPAALVLVCACRSASHQGLRVRLSTLMSCGCRLTQHTLRDCHRYAVYCLTVALQLPHGAPHYPWVRGKFASYGLYLTITITHTRSHTPCAGWVSASQSNRNTLDSHLAPLPAQCPARLNSSHSPSYLCSLPPMPPSPYQPHRSAKGS